MVEQNQVLKLKEDISDEYFAGYREGQMRSESTATAIEVLRLAQEAGGDEAEVVKRAMAYREFIAIF